MGATREEIGFDYCRRDCSPTGGRISVTVQALLRVPRVAPGGEGPGAGCQQGREKELRANEGGGHSLQELPSHLRVVDVTPVQWTRVA